jgi:glycine hydroxymethyltransferase
VASLAITLCEMVACGENYAAALVRNARALGTALAEEGVTVVGLDQGVSASHQVLIVTDNVRLTEIPAGLEAATLLCTVVRLVTRNGATARAGLRLGTNELTRRGMGPSEMKVVASLFRRLLIDGEPPDQIAKAAYELRRQFNDVHYTLSTATSTTARG